MNPLEPTKACHDCETILTASLGRLASIRMAIRHGADPKLLESLTAHLADELVSARDYLQRVNHPH